MEEEDAEAVSSAAALGVGDHDRPLQPPAKDAVGGAAAEHVIAAQPVQSEYNLSLMDTSEQ